MRMMSIPSSGEETGSDSSGMMRTQRVPLRKMGVVVVSVCAALLLAMAVIVNRKPQEFQEVMKGIPKRFQKRKNLKNLLGLQSTCSHDGSNCWETKCCKNPNHKCYAKNQYWAQCMGTCDKTYQDKYDRARNIKTGWSCIHPHEHDGTCAKDDENCETNTDCCKKDWVCYVKNKGWSNCNPQCKRGIKANGFDPQDTEGWSCEIHGLTYGGGATLPENATIEQQLLACMSHYCPHLNADSTASQNATCLSEKCSYYHDQFKQTTTTQTTTRQTMTTTTIPGVGN